MSTLTSFVNFPFLPLELQHLIWDHAIEYAESIPRIQRIAYDRSRSYDNYNLLLIHYPHPVPSILQICSYTRTRALNIYTLWSAVVLGADSNESHRKVFVNKPVDIFYFDGEEGIQFWLPTTVYQIFYTERTTHANARELALVAESRLALTHVKAQLQGCAHFAFNLEIYRFSFGRDTDRAWHLRDMWFDTLPDIESMTIVRQVNGLAGEDGNKAERRLVNVPSHFFLQDYIMRSPTQWRSEGRIVFDLRDWKWQQGRQLDVRFAIAVAAEEDGNEEGEEWLGYNLSELSKMKVHEW